jgi:hypothetical protein
MVPCDVASRLSSAVAVLLAFTVIETGPTALAQPPEAPAQEEPVRPNEAQSVLGARARVARGEALFERGDYDAALTEFQAAYDEIGDHPNRYLILYNIGQCHERKFRYDLALRFYQRYLEEGGASAEGRETVEAALRDLDSLLATVRFDVRVRSEVWIGERQVGNAPGAVRIPAGMHVVELRADGYLPARREVQVPAGGEITVSLELVALSEQYRGISPVFFWVSGGIAVATLIAGGIVGVAALGERSSVQARLTDSRDRWNVTMSDLDGIASLSTTADILFGTAALFAVGALVLALLTDFEGEDEEEDPQAPSIAFDGSSLSGAF